MASSAYPGAAAFQIPLTIGALPLVSRDIPRGQELRLFLQDVLAQVSLRAGTPGGAATAAAVRDYLVWAANYANVAAGNATSAVQLNSPAI
jgi:hypothetical protein